VLCSRYPSVMLPEAALRLPTELYHHENFTTLEHKHINHPTSCKLNNTLLHTSLQILTSKHTGDPKMAFTNTEFFGGAITVDLPSNFADTRLADTLAQPTTSSMAHYTDYTIAKSARFLITRKFTLTLTVTHPSSPRSSNMSTSRTTKRRCSTILPT
jgi:hypothetical protein